VQLGAEVMMQMRRN